MSTQHPDLGPELRQLAQAILDRLDPAVRAAAALTASGSEGKCQQLWCPVCALAALVNGEEHPLLTVISEHSVTLMTTIRAMADGGQPPPDPGSPAPDSGGPDGGAPAPSRYQHIPITVEE